MERIKSILHDESKCYFCGSTSNLEMHHIYGGNPNRKISEQNGFRVRLCHWCHNEPPNGVHHNRHRDILLKQTCQSIYEQYHTRAEFRALIGKSYL